MARPAGLSKEQLLSLVQGGAQHREEQKAKDPIPSPAPTPEAAPEKASEKAAPPAPKVAASSVPAPAPSPALEPPVKSRVEAKAPVKRAGQGGDGEEEPPAEIPEANVQAPGLGLPRSRRVGLRSDPLWQMKTLYLKKATIAATEQIARSMGVEFSEFVEYALALQAQPETRSARLAALMASRETLG